MRSNVILKSAYCERICRVLYKQTNMNTYTYIIVICNTHFGVMLCQTQRRQKYESPAERFANARAIYYVYIISRLLVFFILKTLCYVLTRIQAAANIVLNKVLQCARRLYLNFFGKPTPTRKIFHNLLYIFFK